MTMIILKLIVATCLFTTINASGEDSKLIICTDLYIIILYLNAVSVYMCLEFGYDVICTGALSLAVYLATA